MDTTNLLGSILPYGIGGNFILLIIALCSVISIGVFIERLIVLNRSDADTNQLILKLRDQIEKGNTIEAITLCETTGGTIAAILKAGLMKASRGKEQMESAMEIAGMMEIASLERNAKILSVIAHIAPLIGLLGTVVGFIQAFSEMKTSGLVDISANQIGEAMEYALVTTAAGLAVAIPTVIGYNYLVSRVESYVLEMQTTSSEIVDIMMNRDAF
jgi:biopolymer transport protein ExbB